MKVPSRDKKPKLSMLKRKLTLLITALRDNLMNQAVTPPDEQVKITMSKLSCRTSNTWILSQEKIYPRDWTITWMTRALARQFPLSHRDSEDLTIERLEHL